MEMLDCGLPSRDVDSFIGLHFPFIFLGLAILSCAGILYVRAFPRLSRQQQVSYLLAFNLCMADILYGFFWTPQVACAVTGIQDPCPFLQEAKRQLFFHPAFSSVGVIAWCAGYGIHLADDLHPAVSIVLAVWLLMLPWSFAALAVQAGPPEALDRGDVTSGPLDYHHSSGDESQPCPGLDSAAYSSAKWAALRGWAAPACTGTLLLFLVVCALPQFAYQRSALVMRTPVCDSRPPPSPASTQGTSPQKKKDEDHDEKKEAPQDSPVAAVVVAVAAAADQATTIHPHSQGAKDPDPDLDLDPLASQHAVEVPSEEEVGCLLYYQGATLLSLLYMASLPYYPSAGSKDGPVTVWDRREWVLYLCQLRVAMLPCVWALRHLCHGAAFRRKWRLRSFIARPFKRRRVLARTRASVQCGQQ